MNEEGYGPGIGTLIGFKMASVDARGEALQSELGAMRAKLRATIASGVYDSAFAHAAADLTAEIISELKDEQDGKAGARRLSDPANVEARNEAYVDSAAKHVYRLSAGKTSMPREERLRIKARRPVR